MTTPNRWYWIICALGLMVNASEAHDYVMTVTENAEFVSRIPVESLAYLNSMSDWTLWPWAIAVWGSVVGWVLMLLRRKIAVSAFMLALAGFIVIMVYFAMTGGFMVISGAEFATMCLVLATSIFAVWFARRSNASGVLR